MRISDWSSDVCSSDLLTISKGFRPMQALKALVIFMAVLIVAGMVLLVYGLVSRTGGGGSMGGGEPIGGGEGDVASLDLPVPDGCTIAGAELAGERSEERRVGKECVRTGNSWWAQD